VRVVGLTGGVGSGKSTVAAAFAEKGARIIDADVIAREVIEPGTKGFDAVTERFQGVGANGEIDRSVLAEIVFADEQARKHLEAIVHPLVRQEANRQVAELEGEDGIALLVVPLLIESGHYAVERLIVVDCEPTIAAERLMESRGWSELQARQRMNAQISREERLSAADYVIDNSGTRKVLDDQIERCWNWLNGEL
jgi:dephospho-CoA kinase